MEALQGRQRLARCDGGWHGPLECIGWHLDLRARACIPNGPPIAQAIICALDRLNAAIATMLQKLLVRARTYDAMCHARPAQGSPLHPPGPTVR
eukprot:1137412-Pyramimonas_sp.AAC.1